jgi:hypothetical protein
MAEVVPETVRPGIDPAPPAAAGDHPSEVLSRSATSSPRRIIDPVHPHCCWPSGLHSYFSRRAVACRGIPFCPCYFSVDHAISPDLCCSCVGETGQVSYPEGTSQATRPD